MSTGEKIRLGKLREYNSKEGWVLLDKSGNLYSVAINQILQSVEFSKEVKRVLSCLMSLTMYHPRRDSEIISVRKDMPFVGYLLKSYGLKESGICGGKAYYIVKKSVKRSHIRFDYEYVKLVLENYLIDIEIG